MAIPDEMLRRAVALAPGAAPLSPLDARHVFEVACLAVVSDGRIADEEVTALRVLGGELRAISPGELDAFVQASVDLRTREERLERLRVVAAALTTEQARHLAYKVSVVTAMADLAAADEEFEFDLDLQDALELPADVADHLAGEVHEALTPDED